MKRIIKLIWNNRELWGVIAGEKKYAVGLSLLIFLIVFLMMVAMAQHDYQQAFERINHIENRMNSFDPNIKDMTVIK